MLMEEEAYVNEEAERRAEKKSAPAGPRVVRGSANPHRGRGGADTRGMDWEGAKKTISGFFTEAFR